VESERREYSLGSSCLPETSDVETIRQILLRSGRSSKPWKHPLTRDPRVKRHEKHIQEYFDRRSQILRDREKLLRNVEIPNQTLTTANPMVEPIPRGSSQDTRLWNLIVRAFHPMPFMGGVGRYIRFYVRNSSDDQILGCLSLGSAVLRCAARDTWIGWSMQQRIRNLGKVANNRRFLILPNVRVPNLASRVLSLLCAAGPREWQNRYGDPLVLIETFVESKYYGSCYRAANWIQLGETKGFTHVVSEIAQTTRKRVSLYLYTGDKKRIFVRPLHSSWRKELIA